MYLTFAALIINKSKRKAMNNIKIVLIAAVLLMFSTYSDAQVRLGVKVGPTFSKISSNSLFDFFDIDVKNKVGVNAGVFAEIDMGYNFIFQPGIEFNQKGHVLHFGTDQFSLFDIEIPLSAQMRTRVNQIDIPLLFKYEVGNEMVQFYAEAGPVIGLALSGDFKVTTDVIVPITLLRRDMNFDAMSYNRFEVAGRFGLGVSTYLGDGKLHFGGAFQYGFNDVYDFPLFDFRPKNKGFMITAGYSYPLMR